jgi:tetratricopeptide (TPR) repeat protein
LQQEAYDNVLFERIRMGNDYYSTKRLAAIGSDLGAIACFFETPWKAISSALKESTQGVVVNFAAYCLRALGRLNDALELMRTGVEMAKRASDAAMDEQTQLHQSNEAARRASNLSELELTLGEVATAVWDAEQSVTYADRSSDTFWTLASRATHADTLHQAGRMAEAQTRFREAEQMQAESQPDYPLLYSVRGFKYCDLLLAASERAAWQMMLELKTQNLELETSMKSCRAVSQRGAQTLDWWTIQFTNAPLLDIALDHLTLGRAALYEIVLALDGLPFKTQSLELKTSIDASVDGLRRSGHQERLPSGLLTRSWLRSLTEMHIGPASAQEDLDEAWEIAERGPMRLHMADIHLYRARLFHGVKPYPWGADAEGNARGPKDDLAAARKLIEQCGYWRRKEELEDAEEAAKNW